MPADNASSAESNTHDNNMPKLTSFGPRVALTVLGLVGGLTVISRLPESDTAPLTEEDKRLRKEHRVYTTADLQRSSSRDGFLLGFDNYCLLR